MKFLRFALSLAVLNTAAACSAPKGSDDGAPNADNPIRPIASGDLAMVDGTPAGAVKLIAEGEKVQLVVSVSGLPDGQHGFHLHQTGKCTAPDFKSAGGHLNPLGKTHGTDSPGGSHVGDLPNLDLSANNSEPQKFAIEGTEAQISEWVLDDDGTAVVIHAEPDDYKTDPSGAAGSRIACAVLSAS